MLIFLFQSIYDSDSSAAERNHRGSFIVSFANIFWKVVLWHKLSTGQLPAFRLDNLSLDQVEQDLRKELRNVRGFELLGENLSSPGNEEVGSEDGIRLPVDFVSSSLAPPGIGLVDYIILQQRSVVRYFYACSK